MKKTCILMMLALVVAGCGNAQNKDPKKVSKSVKHSVIEVPEKQDESDSGEGAESFYEDDLMDISVMPKTAERMDSYFQYAVYVNQEKAPSEDDMVGVSSVWLADERTGTVRKVCQTNPMAEAQWEKMRGPRADAVDVPIQDVAAAEKAWIAPGDVSKVIVEGCPDGRNIWTYIIDADKHTAKQLSTTEGVQELDWENKEIILALYGYYPEGGRYTYNVAYDLKGKFLRQVTEKQPE